MPAVRRVNPQSCQVHLQPLPSAEELDHDFYRAVRRSSRTEKSASPTALYEDVLVVRVHDLVPESEWRTRYDRRSLMNSKSCSSTGAWREVFEILPADQQGRTTPTLQERLVNPFKHWKFSLHDLDERKLWDNYQRAYEDALAKIPNTNHAPSWHIVPADRNWYRNLVVSRTLRETLEQDGPENAARYRKD